MFLTYATGTSHKMYISRFPEHPMWYLD